GLLLGLLRPGATRLARLGGAGAVLCGLVVLGRVAGEGDEDVVEGGAAQADVVDLYATGVQLANDLGEQLGPAHHRDGERAGVLVDSRRALAEALQQLGGGGYVCTVLHHDFDALAARLGLELVGGAAGDDETVVDDADVVRETVGLLQVLGGQQQGRAAG